MQFSDGPVEALKTAAVPFSSPTAQPHSLTFPSALLLGFKVKAKLMGMESDKAKSLCGNLSSMGHGSWGGHGFFCRSPP